MEASFKLHFWVIFNFDICMSAVLGLLRWRTWVMLPVHAARMRLQVPYAKEWKHSHEIWQEQKCKDFTLLGKYLMWFLSMWTEEQPWPEWLSSTWNMLPMLWFSSAGEWKKKKKKSSAYIQKKNLVLAVPSSRRWCLVWWWVAAYSVLTTRAFQQKLSLEVQFSTQGTKTSFVA